jgi:hypothetical protein
MISNVIFHKLLCNKSHEQCLTLDHGQIPVRWCENNDNNNGGNGDDDKRVFKRQMSLYFGE